jgi:ABC-type protease/lipase transport system fused ATPase/permease subunit
LPVSENTDTLVLLLITLFGVLVLSIINELELIKSVVFVKLNSSEMSRSLKSKLISSLLSLNTEFEFEFDFFLDFGKTILTNKMRISSKVTTRKHFKL